MTVTVTAKNFGSSEVRSISTWHSSLGNNRKYVCLLMQNKVLKFWMGPTQFGPITYKDLAVWSSTHADGGIPSSDTCCPDLIYWNRGRRPARRAGLRPRFFSILPTRGYKQKRHFGKLGTRKYATNHKRVFPRQPIRSDCEENRLNIIWGNYNHKCSALAELFVEQ